MVWHRRMWMWTFFQQEAFVGTGFHFRVWRSAFTFLQKFEDNLERDNGNLEWISQDSCVGLLTTWLWRRGFFIVEKMFWQKQHRSLLFCSVWFKGSFKSHSSAYGWWLWRRVVLILECVVFMGCCGELMGWIEAIKTILNTCEFFWGIALISGANRGLFVICCTSIFCSFQMN
jgi:hypothetical protein